MTALDMKHCLLALIASPAAAIASSTCGEVAASSSVLTRSRFSGIALGTRLLLLKLDLRRR